MLKRRRLPPAYLVTLRQRVQSRDGDWSVQMKRGLPGRIPRRSLVVERVTRVREEPPRARYLQNIRISVFQRDARSPSLRMLKQHVNTELFTIITIKPK